MSRTDEFLEQIAKRATPPTVEALFARAEPIDATKRFLHAGQFAVLAAACDVLIPQSSCDADRVDLAGRIDQNRLNGDGDGWRYDALPADDSALRIGLDTIEAIARERHGAGFTMIPPDARYAIVDELIHGSVTRHGFDASRWALDLLAEATESFAAHPATLARMGYSGVMFPPKWTNVGLNATQPWEPRPHAGEPALP